MNIKVARIPKTNPELKNSNLKHIFRVIQSSDVINRRAIQKITGLLKTLLKK